MKRPNAPGVDHFRPELEPEDVDRLWQGLDGAARRRTQARLVRVAIVSSALVAGLISLAVSWSQGPKPLTSSGVVLVAGANLPLTQGPVHFDDGSRITRLGDQAARLEVITSRPDRFVTILREGSVSVQVTPGGPRAWVIETDLASIEVVGTAFDVIRGPGRLEVKVQHGTVVVSGERVEGRVQRVTAGQSVRIEAEVPAPARPEVVEPTGIEPTAAPTAASPSGGQLRPEQRPRPAQVHVEEAPAPVSPAPAPPPRPSFEAVLDRFAELDAQGESIAAELYLQDAIREASAGAAATLSFELGRWLLAQPGRGADAAEALGAVDRPGAPPELIRAAQTLREKALRPVRSD